MNRNAFKSGARRKKDVVRERLGDSETTQAGRSRSWSGALRKLDVSTKDERRFTRRIKRRMIKKPREWSKVDILQVKTPISSQQRRENYKLMGQQGGIIEK